VTERDPTRSLRFVAPPATEPLEAARPPTFSVIIAAYQAAATIGEAVESALSQTVPPHEVIVCDDGSTDALHKALQPYRHRIVLLRQENKGAASARNAALRVATGELVAQLDSDDVFLPERIEALRELAVARPDLDIYATDAYLEVEGEVVDRFYSDEHTFPTSNQRTTILQWCFVAWPAVQRQKLLALGGFDETLVTGDDWDAWLRMILAGSKAGIVDEPLLRYRLRPGSVTADRARVLRERVSILEKAAANPHLRPDEHHLLEDARRVMSRRALLVEAEAALRTRAPDVRRRALALARAPQCPIGVRLKAAGATLAPRVAAALLERREDSTRRRGDSAARVRD
jgi:Glycosyl transferase family 2